MSDLFSQKSAGSIPRGVENQAVDANPAPPSSVEAPVWKSFVVNKGFQEANKEGIAAERDLMRQAGRARRETWGGDNGRLFRKSAAGLEQFDAEDYGDDPQVGGYARKSVWDKDRRTAAAEHQSLSLALQDPRFKAREKSDKEIADIQAEAFAYPTADPRHAELQAKIDDDAAFRREKADIERRAYDARVRAFQIEQTDPDTHWANRVAPDRTAEVVAGHQAAREEAVVADASALDREKALRAELSSGVKGGRLAEVQAELAEISAGRGVIGESRVEADKGIEKVAEDAAKPKKDFWETSDVISGIWDSIKGIGSGAPAAFYQLVEGMERPDQYSERAKAAFAEADAWNKELQAKTADNQAAGKSSSVGESIREGGQSLSGSLGTLAASVPAMLAGAKVGGLAGGAIGSVGAGVGAAPGAAIGASIGGGVAAGAVSGTAMYRMAGASFLNEMFQQLNAESVRKSGREMNEEEKQSAYNSLLPIAQNTGLWEAGPEALSNAVTLGAGKIIFGLGKPIAEKFAAAGLKKAAQFAGTTAGKIAIKTGAAAGEIATELGTETVTQVEQGADQLKGQAIAQGRDPSSITADWSSGGVVDAFKEVAPQTLGLLGLTFGAGGVIKGGAMALDRVTAMPPDQLHAEVSTALTAVDPEAPRPSPGEIKKAMEIVPATGGATDIADGILIERELSRVSMEDDAALVAARDAVAVAEASGDKAAVAAAEKARDAVAGRSERVRAVLKIASGMPTDELSPKELKSLGLFKNKEKNGLPDPLPEEDLKKMGLDDVLAYPSDHDGTLIITDDAIKLVRAVSPRAADRVKMNETAAIKRAKERAEKLSTDTQNGAVAGATTSQGVPGDPATGLGLLPIETNAAVESSPSEFDVPMRSGRIVRVAAKTGADAEAAVAGSIPPHSDSVVVGGAKQVQISNENTNQTSTEIPPQNPQTDGNPDPLQGSDVLPEGGLGEKPGSPQLDVSMQGLPGETGKVHKAVGAPSQLVEKSTPPPVSPLDAGSGKSPALVAARARFAKIKRKLKDRITEGGEYAETRPEGITVNVKAVIDSALAKGMTDKQAADYFSMVLDEEIRHLAQYDAAKILFRAAGSPGSFPDWMEAHYASIWQSEFAGEKGDIVRDLYAREEDRVRPDWETMSDANKALEAIRMMSQGDNVTETAKLWTNIGDALRNALKAALAALKQFSDIASPALQQEITNLENALKQLTGPSAKTDSKKPAARKTGDGTGGTAKGQRDSGTGGNGGVESPPGDGTGSPLVVGAEVEFDGPDGVIRGTIGNLAAAGKPPVTSLLGGDGIARARVKYDGISRAVPVSELRIISNETQTPTQKETPPAEDRPGDGDVEEKVETQSILFPSKKAAMDWMRENGVRGGGLTKLDSELFSLEVPKGDYKLPKAWYQMEGKFRFTDAADPDNGFGLSGPYSRQYVMDTEGLSLAQVKKMESAPLTDTPPAKKPTVELTPAEEQAKNDLFDAFEGIVDGLRTSPLPGREPFYSQLARTLETKMPKSATPAQVIQITTSGAKAEEIKWSGLAQAAQSLAVDGKVDKAKLLEWLENEGSVRFEEVSTTGETVMKWSRNDEYSNGNEELMDDEDMKAALEDAAQGIRDSFNLNDEVTPIDEDGDETTDDSDEYRPVKWRVNLSDGSNESYDSRNEAYDRLQEELKWIEEESVSIGESSVVDWNGNTIISFEQEAETSEGATRFSQYTLPGGENYREVVLAMPDASPRNVAPSPAVQAKYAEEWKAIIKEHGGFSEQADALHDKMVKETVASRVQNYQSSHFPDVPNYVAHMRLNERTDGDGKPGLFIEEIQSDRHQAGKKKGYTGPTAFGEFTREMKAKYGKTNTADIVPNMSDEEFSKYTSLRDQFRGKETQGEIAEAPYEKSWPLALFKRALRDAVAGNKSWIGWTTGTTQADRFDLSQHVEAIRATKGKGDVWELEVKPKGRDVSHLEVTEENLPDHIGKDLAQKIVEDGGGTYQGLDLKVGGEGMKGFYDSILPKEIGKYVKQWGGKVEQTNLVTDGTFDSEDGSWTEGEGWTSTPIWRIEITPEMRKGVSQGQALFTSPLPTTYRSTPPADKLPAFQKAAQSLIAAGVDSPEKLAAFLEKIAPGSLRPYSEFLWRQVNSFLMGDEVKTDWDGVYSTSTASTAATPTTPEDASAPDAVEVVTEEAPVAKEEAPVAKAKRTSRTIEEDIRRTQKAIEAETKRMGGRKMGSMVPPAITAELNQGSGRKLDKFDADLATLKQELAESYEVAPVTPAAPVVKAAKAQVKSGVDRLEEIEQKIKDGTKITPEERDELGVLQEKFPMSHVVSWEDDGVAKSEKFTTGSDAQDFANTLMSKRQFGSKIFGIGVKSSRVSVAAVETTAPAAETKAAKAVSKKPDTNTKKLKAQKEYLLAALDKAIEEADDTPLTQEQLDAIREIDDNWQAERDYSTPEDSAEKRAGRAKAIEIFNGPLIPKIEIEVPGDGTFRIVNTKSAIAEFREKVKKKFPTSTPTAAEPKQGATSPTAITPIGKPKEVADFQKIAAIATTKDETREVLKAIHNDGENIVATDGRRVLVITRKTVGSAEKPINLDPKTLKPAKDKEGDSLTFPNWRQVVPTELEEEIPIDTAVMQKLAIQAAEMTSDKQNSVYLWRDASGKLGLTSQSADVGMFAGGDIDPDTAKLLGAYNSDYFNDGLIAMRRLGFDKVTMQYTDEMSPVMFVAEGVKYVLMPMRGDFQEFHPLSKAAEDAEVKRQAELDAAAAEREARAEAARVKEAERIAKIVGEVEPEVVPEEAPKPSPAVPEPQSDFTPTTAAGHEIIEAVKGKEWHVTSTETGEVVNISKSIRDGFIAETEGTAKSSPGISFQAAQGWVDNYLKVAAKVKRPTELSRALAKGHKEVFRNGKFVVTETDSVTGGTTYGAYSATDGDSLFGMQRFGSLEAAKKALGIGPETNLDIATRTIEVGDDVLVQMGGREVTTPVAKIQGDSAWVDYFGQKLVKLADMKIHKKAQRNINDAKIKDQRVILAEKQKADSEAETAENRKQWQTTDIRTTDLDQAAQKSYAKAQEEIKKAKLEQAKIKPTESGFTESGKSEYAKQQAKIDAATKISEQAMEYAKKPAPAKAQEPAAPKPTLSSPKDGTLIYKGMTIEKTDGVQLGYQTSKGRGKGRKVSGYDISDEEGNTVKFVETLKEAKAYVDQYVGEEDKKSPSQIAADNWPEDEAAMVLSDWKNREGYTDAEIIAALDKDREHFKKVFSTEDDAEDLMARFNAALDKGIVEMGIGKPATQESIEDFGEKIGGARKDNETVETDRGTALRTSPLPSRLTADSPEWQAMSKEERVAYLQNQKPHFATLSELEMTDPPFSAQVRGETVEVLGTAADFDPNVAAGIFKPDTSPDRFRWWKIEHKDGRKENVSVYEIRKSGRPLLPLPNNTGATEIPIRSLYTSPLPPRARDAFKRNEALFRNAEEQTKAFGKGSAGADPKFANPGLSPDTREPFDIARVIDSHQREVRKDRDTFSRGREFLEKYPEEVERLAMGAYDERPDRVDDYQQHAINLFLDRKAKQLAGDPNGLEELVVLASSNIIMRREHARTMRMMADKYATPEERARAAFADAIFEPNKTVAARAEVMAPKARKEFLLEEGKKRLAKVREKVRKETGFELEQVLGEKKTLKAENSKLMREIKRLRSVLDQSIIKDVQSGAQLKDLVRKWRVTPEHAAQVMRDFKADWNARLSEMIASGMSKEEVMSAMRDSLKTSPLGDSPQNAMTPEQIQAIVDEVNRDLGIVFEIPSARIKAPRIKAKPKAEMTEAEIAAEADNTAKAILERIAKNRDNPPAPKNINPIRELVRRHTRKPVMGFRKSMRELGVSDAQIDALETEITSERERINAMVKTARQKPVVSNPLGADWSRPDFAEGMASFEFDTKDRANIMNRVEVIRNLAGALGRIDSLKGEQLAKATTALKEIDKILSKYGTDAKGIFNADMTIEEYGFDINDIAQVSAVARAIRQVDADWVDWMSEYLYGSMLFGPQTMLVNGTAGLHGLYQMTIGRSFDMAVNSLAKDPMGAQFGEWKYIARGIKPAWQRAKSNFHASWLSQHPMFERDVLGSEVDWEAHLGGLRNQIKGGVIGGKFGNFMRIPLRILSATDDFNKTLFTIANAGAFAYRMAKYNGMKDGSKEMDRFIAQEVNTPGSDAYRLSASKASRWIFAEALPGQKDHISGETVPHNDIAGILGLGAAKLNDFVNSGDHQNIVAKTMLALLRISFFPFQRTPFNILRQGMRYTPNPISMFDIATGFYGNKLDANATEAEKQKYHNRRADLLERMSMQLQGATVMSALMAMALAEGDDDGDDGIVITGSVPWTPKGRAERDARMRSGLGPYRISWRSGGNERAGFNYGRIEPLGTALGSTIDTIKAIKSGIRNGDGVPDMTWRMASNTLGSLVSQAKEKSFLRGFSDFLDISANAISTDEDKEPDSRKIKQFLAGRAAMLVPNFVRQPVREADGNYREKTDSFMEELLYSAVPYGITDAKVDPYGKKLEKTGFAPVRVIDPTDAGTDTVNPTDTMLLKWADKHPDKKWFPSPILNAEFKHKKTGQNVKMTPEQLATFRQMAGTRASALLKVHKINTQAPTQADVDRVKEIISQSRSEMKNMLAFKFSR